MDEFKVDGFCMDKFQAVRELTNEEKIKNLEILIEKKNQARLRIDEKLEQRELNRFKITMQLEFLPMKYNVMHLYNRRDEIQQLQRALDEYNRVDEFKMQIRCLFHRLKSGRNSLAEERRILKEIKCLQEQEQSFCAKVEAKKWISSYLPDTLNSKESIQGHLELIFDELRGSMIRDQKDLNHEFDNLNRRLLAAERNISSLKKKVDRISEEVKKLYAFILELKKKNSDNP